MADRQTSRGTYWLWLLLPSLAACGARSQLDTAERVSTVAGAPQMNDDSPATSTAAGGVSAAACVSLGLPPQAVAAADDLRIEFACGVRQAALMNRSEFQAGGTTCGTMLGLNTFALRLQGRDAAAYSAVVRCGYIRYDNGSFVGARVQVEARDGAWCDDLALQRIELVDRMLLTDVGFAVESRQGSAPKRNLSATFSMRTGSTTPVSPERALCVYVANRAPGVASCRLAAPSPNCVCPCDQAWGDFFESVKLSLLAR